MASSHPIQYKAMLIAWYCEQGTLYTLSGQESTYSEPFYTLPDIGVVPAAQRKAAYMAAIKADLDTRGDITSRFVFRSRNTEYSIQIPNGKYGFPKGGGNTFLDGGHAKKTALREFQEEVGYTIDDIENVVYCGEQMGVHVYTYKVTPSVRRAIEAAIEVQRQLRYGELFDVRFRSTDAIERNSVLWNVTSIRVFHSVKQHLACSSKKQNRKTRTSRRTRKQSA